MNLPLFLLPTLTRKGKRSLPVQGGSPDAGAARHAAWCLKLVVQLYCPLFSVFEF